ncbi:MAG: 30S ribosomal protein S18 [Clostridia bacterium]|nr:30S ribosomal protein S18 [Clostridia bacterium]
MAAEEKEVKEPVVEQKPAEAVAEARPAKKYAKPQEGAENAEGHKARRPMQRRKVCQFCLDKVKDIDYKDVAKLRKYITENGKIVSRRQTGTCAYHQREIANAIKRARHMALIHYKGE